MAGFGKGNPFAKTPSFGKGGQDAYESREDDAAIKSAQSRNVAGDDEDGPDLEPDMDPDDRVLKRPSKRKSNRFVPRGGRR